MKNPFRRAPEDMPADDLVKYLAELTRSRKELGEEMAKAKTLLDGKLGRERAAKKLAAMTDPERRALAQELRAQGIGSEEALGTPGT